MISQTEKFRQLEILNSLVIKSNELFCELANTDKDHKKYYFLTNELTEVKKAIAEKIKFIESI